MDYLFVITYGRSGSTVLLNLLNAIDGYTLRGENNGVATSLAKTVSLLAEGQGETRANTTLSHAPWYGIMDVDRSAWAAHLAAGFRDEFLRPEPGTRVLGFKEIRYTPDDMNDADYHATIRFLADNFPGARFIFNTRNWAEVAESGWWRYYPNLRVIRDLVRGSDTRFKASVAELGDRAFLIDYAAFASNAAGFRPLIDWLGEDVPDADLERVTQHRLKHAQFKYDDRGKLLMLRRMVSKRLAGAAG